MAEIKPFEPDPVSTGEGKTVVPGSIIPGVKFNRIPVEYSFQKPHFPRRRMRLFFDLFFEE